MLRRNCFYLFVPEWRGFAQSLSSEQNQRDFENYYRNTNTYAIAMPRSSHGTQPIQQNPSDSQQRFESKWISLQQLPSMSISSPQ